MPATPEGSRESARSSRSVVPLAVMWALVLGYALLFGWLSLQRYWAFEMHALDMGNMGQAAWNTIHGHPFYFTNMRLQYQLEAWYTTTRLSFHVEALFPFIALVYVVYPHPESLLVLQTVALALGAPAVFLLARDVLKSAWLATVFAAAYLLYPTLEAMNLYEFHPVSLATPLLLYAFLFAWRRQYIPFALCCLAAIGTKEQIGLVVAMFGLYIALVNRDWAIGLSTAVVAAAISLVAALVVEPHFRQPGTVTYLHSRYGYLGHGVRGVITNVFRHPESITSQIFTYSKAAYLRQLLAPTGYLAFFAIPLMALVLPSLGLNLLSATPAMYSALGQDSAEMISAVMIASILGCRVVMKIVGPRWSLRGAQVLLGAYVLITALWNQRENGFTPLGDRYQAPQIGAHQRIESHFVSMVPPSVPVSTQDELDPHLSDRHYLYLFRDTGSLPNPPLVPASYILLDVSGPTYPLTSTELHLAAQSYLRRPGWGVLAADNGLILIKKGAASHQIPPAFYSYALPSGSPQHAVHLRSHGLEFIGYDVTREDMPNYRIPRLAYTFYVRSVRPLKSNLQPVLFERVGKTTTCSSDPLGLAWLPTSRWKPGRTYVVRMAPIETNTSGPGTARLYVGVAGMAVPHFKACPRFSPHHTTQVGVLPFSF